MRLLEHFDQAWFRKIPAAQSSPAICGCRRRPATPASTIGAAWLLRILRARARRSDDSCILLRLVAIASGNIATALEAGDIASRRIGDISTPEGRDASPI